MSVETIVTFKLTEHEDGSVSFTEADPLSLYNAKIAALAYANTFVHGCKEYMLAANEDEEIISMLTSLAEFKYKFNCLVDQVGAECSAKLSEESKVGLTESLTELIEQQLSRETLH